MVMTRRVIRQTPSTDEKCLDLMIWKAGEIIACDGQRAIHCKSVRGLSPACNEFLKSENGDANAVRMRPLSFASRARPGLDLKPTSRQLGIIGTAPFSHAKISLRFRKHPLKP